MKRIISIILIYILVLGLLPIQKAYGESLENKYIDVKLSRPLIQNNYVNLSSPSGFYIYNVNEKNYPLFYIEDTTIIAVANNGYIDLLDSNNNILYTLPSDGSQIIGANNSNESIITVEKDKYRDYIKFLIKNNELVVVNHVYLEHYLYGVVPREMTYTFPMEALKAQAVASRSYCLSNINKHIQEGYNLCDTTHCQVYGGYIYERESTNQAVNETKNILIYYEGKVIEAIYHSTSSGYTEDSSNVWGNNIQYLKSVEDPFSGDSPYSSWKYSIKINELNDKLIGAGINIGNLQNIEIIETTPTNKVKKVKLIGTLGEEIITGDNFRSIIGSTSIKSTWFNIKGGFSNTIANIYVLDGNLLKPKVIDVSKAHILDGNNIKTVTRSMVSRAMGKDRIEDISLYTSSPTNELIIEGRGYGHGVGMSQYGAIKMAELGYSFEEILKYYYTGVDVL